MKSLLQSLHDEVGRQTDKEKAVFLLRFFKTGKGEYGEGDVFAGLTVPQSRIIAKTYKNLALEDTEKLVHSKIHEERLIALLILVAQFQRAKNTGSRKNLVDFYLANTKYINNWDLVDLSADKIVGEFFKEEKKTDLLKKLAKSDSLWERRIAMISTYAFIKNGSSKETIAIATILLPDRNDLIQKAVGWMLREVGKRVNREDLKDFLMNHKAEMGRTALRYAIEHFPEEERKKYLAK